MSKNSLITYHIDSPAIQELVAEFGDRLTVLNAAEKLNIIAILGDWQETDTQMQEDGHEEVPLSDFLQGTDIRIAPLSGDVERCLDILAAHNLGSDSALNLCIAIIYQLLEGCYLK